MLGQVHAALPAAGRPRRCRAACQVLEWPSTGEAGEADKEMKEAAMAIEFQHPSIVKTFAYAARAKKTKTDTRIQVLGLGRPARLGPPLEGWRDGARTHACAACRRAPALPSMALRCMMGLAQPWAS